MFFRSRNFQPEVVEQRLRPVVLSHHDQQASDDQNQTEHGQMLSSNMLLLNLILLIDVTFSTPTLVLDNYDSQYNPGHETKWLLASHVLLCAVVRQRPSGAG